MLICSLLTNSLKHRVQAWHRNFHYFQKFSVFSILVTFLFILAIFPFVQVFIALFFIIIIFVFVSFIFSPFILFIFLIFLSIFGFLIFTFFLLILFYLVIFFFIITLFFILDLFVPFIYSLIKLNYSNDQVPNLHYS